MSASNPYAPHKKTLVTEVPKVEVVEEAKTEVPTGSVANVLKWVSKDSAKAKEAYEAENDAEKPRVSLLSALKELF